MTVHGVGLGYRRPFHEFLFGSDTPVDFVELVAEHFFDQPSDAAQFSDTYPVAVHGLGLSLGTPGPLDAGNVSQFVAVCRAAKPTWISEHLAFTRSNDVDLGHLNPIPLDRPSFTTVCAHVNELQNLTGVQLLLENITTHLELPGTMTEPEFLNEVCATTGAGILLDATNLYVNSRNRQSDPRNWLQAIEPRHIGQMHVIGFSTHDGQLEDTHDTSIQAPVLELCARVLNHTEHDVPILLEWDRNWPTRQTLEDNLNRIRQTQGNHELSRRPRTAAFEL